MVKVDRESFGKFFDGTPGKSWDDYAARLKNAAAGEVDDRGYSLADEYDGTAEGGPGIRTLVFAPASLQMMACLASPNRSKPNTLTSNASMQRSSTSAHSIASHQPFVSLDARFLGIEINVLLRSLNAVIVNNWKKNSKVR